MPSELGQEQYISIYVAQAAVLKPQKSSHISQELRGCSALELGKNPGLFFRCLQVPDSYCCNCASWDGYKARWREQLIALLRCLQVVRWLLLVSCVRWLGET